jgi:DNA polymerase III subunit delta
MDSLTFLAGDSTAVHPLYVVHGDEGFLKSRVLTALRRLILGPEEGFALSTYSGDKAVWANVMDELRTLPFLSPRRLVIIENADPFVTAMREKLENWVGQLSDTKKPPSTGTLVLEVRSFPGNTKLAKKVPDLWKIECKTPEARELTTWCARYCKETYGKTLPAVAARSLVDLVGPEMGLLDQELAKLASYVGSSTKIAEPDVDKLVGQSRAEETWNLFNLIGAGKTAEAVRYLDRLLDQGKVPMELLGAFRSRMRQLVLFYRMRSQGVGREEAFDRLKVDKEFIRRSIEEQGRHLGRRRLDQLYDLLIQTDLGQKGGSALPPRTQMERLVIQLAQPRT